MSEQTPVESNEPRRRSLGDEPARVTCPSCNASVETKVEHSPSGKTHLVAVLLCFCACWCCVFLPYIIDSCQDAVHYCPNCNAYIGRRPALS